MAITGCPSKYPSKYCDKCIYSKGGIADADRRGKYRVALVGNPNTGKTTLFNLLTGTRHHVGNYPGVTIDKVVGTCAFGAAELEIIDLPGTYSLSPYSLEEIVVRRFLLEEEPDILVLVVDASNLRRNLYLAIQLLELGMPLVIALNMTDVARQNGIIIDVSLLEELIGIPVIPVVARTGFGKKHLLRRVLETAELSDAQVLKKLSEHPVVKYGDVMEEEISQIVRDSELLRFIDLNAPRRWKAIKCLESDHEVISRIDDENLLEKIGEAIRRVEDHYGDIPEAVFAETRYKWIEDICKQSVLFTSESQVSYSDRVDKFFTNRFMGIPLFLGLMYLVFHLTFSVGEPLVQWLESGFDFLGTVTSSLWEPGSDSKIKSLIIDGFIGGVGGVIVFLPNIAILFAAIAFLEESGYMARAAFLMDRIMNKFGLHGKSFIPMILGFGCSVPAIMATRSMEDRTAQRITMLVIPLMSCGGRLPIYALIIPAFFPAPWSGMTLLSIYLIGIILALVGAKILRSTVYKSAPPSFVMELPPYKVPSLKNVSKQMGLQSWYFLQKAGTVILGAAILFWFLGQFPGLPQDQEEEFASRRAAISLSLAPEEAANSDQLVRLRQEQAQALLENSMLGRVGKGLEFFLSPCGFDWKVSTAFAGAIVAKEIFVAQLGVVYSLGSPEEGSGENSLREKLQSNYSPLQAYCIMLFCLIAFPCVATLAVTKRESGSWRFALFQLASLTTFAWILTATVYQVGSLLL